jgi:hypothetical protein
MEIEIFDRKLHTMIKSVENVKIILENLSRNDFTLHGLHLNIPGKEKMAQLIGENIKNTNGKKRRNPLHSEMERKSKES